MSEWLEIPAHRVLMVPRFNFLEDFDCITETGQAFTNGAQIYRAIRKLDGKIFQPARFLPFEHFHRDVICLEEV